VRLGISHAAIEDWQEGVSDIVHTVPGGWQPKYPVHPETGQRLKVDDLVMIKGKRYVVHACDYTTGKPQFVEI